MGELLLGAVAVLHRDHSGILEDLLDRLHRQAHMVQRRVVIDHDVELGEQRPHVRIEPDGVADA